MRLGSIAIRDRYWLTDKALFLLVDEPCPFGPVVKPRCRHCRNTLDVCPGGCSTGTGDRRV